MTQKIQNSSMSGATKKDVYKVACVEVATDLEGDGELKLQRRVFDMVKKHNESGADFKLEILPIPRWPIGKRTMILFNRFMNVLNTFEKGPNHTTAAMLEMVSIMCADFDKPVAIVGAGKAIGAGFISELLNNRKS